VGQVSDLPKPVTPNFPNKIYKFPNSPSDALVNFKSRRGFHRPFFNKFLPGPEALHYDGTELPEPLERLAAHYFM
jgi:hypothetical protein